MTQHIDRAGVRAAVAAIGTALFSLFIWGPVNTLWIAPEVYDGTVFGTHEWRKAWVINGWMLIAPIALGFGYAATTVFRAIKRDQAEEVGK